MKTSLLLIPKKFYLVPLVLGIIVVVLIRPEFIFNRGQVSAYKTEIASLAPLTSTITVSGQVEAENYASMSFLSSGRIGWVGFKEGDGVLQGQIIAALDSTQARENIAKAEAVLRSTQSAVDKVINDTHLWQYGNGGTTGETQTQKTLREQAESARDGAYRDLQSARKQLEWTTIVAPFDGTLINLSDMSVGQNITAASSSVTVVGKGSLKFTANVDETEYGRLVQGQVGTIVLDAFPDERFTGQIMKIGNAATKLATGGSVIPVELSLTADPRLIHGLNGEVEFNIFAGGNFLVVPNSAIKKDNGKQYVNVLDEANKIIKKEIVKGESLGGKSQILSGLSTGEKVILGDVKK